MPSKALLLHVARLSFDKGLTNEQIAARLATDGTFKNPNTKKVAQLLEEAGRWLLAREGLLALIERDVENAELEQRLLKAYPCLIDTMVFRLRPPESEGRWSPLIKPTPWSVAAEYIDDFANTAHDHGETVSVALSGGETVLGVVTSLSPERRANMHFHASAMIGRGRMLSSSHVGPETNATIAWLRSGGIAGHLHYGTIAPPDVLITPKADGKTRHAEACRSIVAETEHLASLKPVSSVLHDMEDATVLVTSFGLLPDLLKAYGVSPEALAQEGMVSDLNYCVFDAEGKPCKNTAFFLTPGYPAGVEFCRQMVREKRRVVVVASIQDVGAFRAAMRGKLLNVLITDEETATALLAQG
jgi:DNA-binding transcriptional regulator LsrR (DeoR family)